MINFIIHNICPKWKRRVKNGKVQNVFNFEGSNNSIKKNKTFLFFKRKFKFFKTSCCPKNHYGHLTNKSIWKYVEFEKLISYFIFAATESHLFYTIIIHYLIIYSLIEWEAAPHRAISLHISSITQLPLPNYLFQSTSLQKSI